MKPEHLNPKALEAQGKSLMDLGTSTLNKVVALVLFVPATIVWKSVFEPTQSVSLLENFLRFLKSDAYFIVMGAISVAIIVGVTALMRGLKFVHNSEQPPIQRHEIHRRRLRGRNVR